MKYSPILENFGLQVLKVRGFWVLESEIRSHQMKRHGGGLFGVVNVGMACLKQGGGGIFDGYI